MKFKVSLVALAAAFILAACSTTFPQRDEAAGITSQPPLTQYEYPRRPAPKKAAPKTESAPTQPIVIVMQDTIVQQPQVQIIRERVVPEKAEIAPIALASPPPVSESELASAHETAQEAMATWPFADQMSKANMAFNTPESIKLGNSADMQLIIDPSKTVEEIKKQIRAEGVIDGSEIKVAKVVVAKVLAPDFEVIEFISQGRQAVDLNGPTEWRWTITPKKMGEHKVTVTVSAVIEIGGDRAERLIKVFEREVAVTVTPGDAIKFFFTKNWQWMWSAIGLPFLVALWKNWKKKRKGSDEDDEDDDIEVGDVEPQEEKKE